jgi:long-chain acyl-CoA synthetase
VNLADIIESHDAESVALISRGRPTTYGALRDQVAAFRGGLIELGVGCGDRVALLCGNGRYFVVSYLATVGLGAVAVPLNPASPGPEIERELAVVEASVVVLEQSAQHSWKAIDRSAVPTVQHVVAPAALDLDGAVSIESLLESPAAPTVDMADEDLAVLIFTSGTAGSPRAAMLSHQNLLSNIEQARSARDSMGPTDVVYGVLPVFHIFGLNVVIGSSLSAGACVVLVQRFDPSTMLDTVRERHVTVLPGAPPLWTSFVQMDGLAADSFATVRLALTGAAKMPEEAQRQLKERFDLDLHEGYGLTEASPVVTSSVGLPVKVGSVGRVLSGMQVRLVDESGNDTIENDPGEIWVKGPNVFLGYLGDTEATERVLTPDGWLRTGDIAVTDDEGYIYLVDRVKDLIIVSGFNVFPAEVEDVLLEHPGVKEAGVVAVPHPHTGEAVKAYVVARPGVDLDEDTLIDYCHDNLARYKCPSKILFVDELPRNISGKLLRRDLI